MTGNRTPDYVSGCLAFRNRTLNASIVRRSVQHERSRCGPINRCVIYQKRQLGANQLAKLGAYAIDGLPLRGSCTKALFHAAHVAADVDESTKPKFVYL